MTRQQIGKLGEDIAVDYLREKNYKILHRNWAKPRWGEIDIIAKHQGILKFIEVRTKTSKQYGDPMESISPKKQKSLQRSIDYFMLTNTPAGSESGYAIEYISVIINDLIKRTVSITHLIN